MIVLKVDLGRRTRKLPVNLFFLELIIVLMFFSISGAIILRVFGAANALAERSSLIERSVMNVQSVSEIYSVKGDIEDALDMLFGNGRYTVNDRADAGYAKKYTVCLGADMFPIITPDIRERYGAVTIEFTDRVTAGECGSYHELDSKVFLLVDGGKEVYAQTSAVYVPVSASAAIPATGENSRADMVKEG